MSDAERERERDDEIKLPRYYTIRGKKKKKKVIIKFRSTLKMPLFDYIKSDKNETRVKKFLIKNCEAETIFFKTIFFFCPSTSNHV